MPEFSYVHIPFCRSKCRYCAFNSYVNLNFIDGYITSLLSEIDFKYDKTPQRALYFGGGTPSLMKIEYLKKIIDKFNFKKNYELTVEVNPETVDYDYLKALFEIKVNRLSIGVQTFDDKILKITGRRHDSKCALKTVEAAKKAGFKNISIDLMYGLPEQTLENWEKTIERAKSLEIEHISAYGLKIEDKTYFSKFPPENLPDDNLQADMYEVLCEKLTGFFHYEISNFAKDKTFVSKNNLNYWTLKPYNGFGAGASGFDKNIRYKNAENLKEYIKNPFIPIEKVLLTPDNLLEETVFLGFRKFEGIDVNKINKKFKIDFNQKFSSILDKYIKSEHLEKTNIGYKLTRKGILVSNYILCDFLL